MQINRAKTISPVPRLESSSSKGSIANLAEAELPVCGHLLVGIRVARAAFSAPIADLPFFG
jgi:hypothetical protein